MIINNLMMENSKSYVQVKLERDEDEVWSFDRSTHFDCRGRIIRNPKTIWGHPDICPKFPLIQEVRLDFMSENE